MLGPVGTPSKRLTYAVLVAWGTLAVQAAYAQCTAAPREVTTEVNNAPYDGRFTFARLGYETGPGGYYYHNLPAWAHGYPSSEKSLMKILDGVTGIVKPRMDRTNVVFIGDPEMFNYPLTYMVEPGYLTLNPLETKALRDYLLKGGFIIFDDFRNSRGNDGWGNFVEVMRQVLPEGRLMPLDSSNPVFHSFFEIKDPHAFISCYDGAGRAEFWGMFENNDPSRRLMFVANFNNDIAQYWEWSDTGFTPIALSNDAYKFGVNYVMYSLTH